MKPRCLLLLLCLALATSLHGQDTAPLQGFLSTPITEVYICSGTCDLREDTIHIIAINDSTLRVEQTILTSNRRLSFDAKQYLKKMHRRRIIRTEMNKRCFLRPVSKPKHYITRTKRRQLIYHPKSNIQELQNIISNINQKPEQGPSIAEFKITAKDKKHYAQIVENVDFLQLNMPTEISCQRWYDSLKHVKEFYLSVAERIDTMNEATLYKFLTKNIGWFCIDGATWFTVEITNKNGEVLRFEHGYDESAWYLPWRVTYNGSHFLCFDPAFSRWVNSQIPKKFYGKKSFNNTDLLLQIAYDLWYKQFE